MDTIKIDNNTETSVHLTGLAERLFRRWGDPCGSANEFAGEVMAGVGGAAR